VNACLFFPVAVVSVLVVIVNRWCCEWVAVGHIVDLTFFIVCIMVLLYPAMDVSLYCNRLMPFMHGKDVKMRACMH